MEYFVPVETHLLDSRHVQQTFKIEVMRPARRAGETTRFPVVYITDSNLMFDALKGISYGLQTFGCTAPRFILVGIGYPGAAPWAGAMLRARDLTFPGFPRFLVQPPPLDGVLVAQQGGKNFHGAEDFQRFIADELTPFIDRTYETIPGERSYFGHSAGASFGLFTAFTRPTLFRNHILVSPALTFDGESADGVVHRDNDFGLREARKFIAGATALNDVRLYMAVGAEEEFDPDRAQWRFTSSFYRLAAMLRSAAIPGLEMTAEVFPAETHMTVWPMAFVRGIRTVFGRRGR